MRKIISVFILLSFFQFSIAQTNGQKAASEKVSEILAFMPAQNKDQLNKSMELMSSLNENDLITMLGKFTAPGQGDNTALEYAVAGYSFYVMQPGKEEQRKTIVAAYCAALDKEQNDQNKQFLIRQLQQTGKDDAVNCLQKYLGNETLVGPVARALAQINSPASEKVLLDALKQSDDRAKLSLIEALGYAQYKPAAAAISAITKDATGESRKVGLFALARIADPTSATLLEQAAKQAHYTFDETDAVSAYILYLQKLAATGNKSTASRLSAKLMSDASTAKAIHTRTAALKLQVDMNGAAALPLLYAAMKDANSEYRAAALQFALPYQSGANNKQWLKTMSGISSEAKVQVLYMLANTKDKSLLPQIQPYLKDQNAAVKAAAIQSIGKLGQQDALATILPLMKSGKQEDIQAVKNSIILMKGDQVTSILERNLQGMPAPAKAALIEVLAARRASHAADEIFNYTKDNDTAVQRAAMNALPAVVSDKDLARLFPMIGSTNDKYIKPVQQSIINASLTIKDTAARTKLIIDEMNRAAESNKWIYLDILAATGSNGAIDAIEKSFENGNEKTRSAAISALSNSTGKKAASTLLAMAGKTTTTADKEAAVDGYIHIITSSNFQPEQKLLMLQEVMGLASAETQRKKIIREAGRTGTFPALIFAGKFLDDASVEQDAALTVMNIALSHKEFNGDIVRRLLDKTSAVLKGQDADYQRQAIKKHLTEMPAGDGFVALFNGQDLSGWKGLVADPIKRSKMDSVTLAKEQEKADKTMKEGWSAKDGLLIFNGHGENLATVKQYGDFEMFVDWKITKNGDAGIYLRGTPQVQIWDTSRVDVGAQVGSGGLYNNQKNQSKPLVMADNGIGEWNNFHIIMKGDKVTVYLNGQLVTDNTVLENYWDRSLPIFSKEQIELQAHGTYVAYRNIYLKELTGSAPFVLSDDEKQQGFNVLFDGSNLDQWIGNKIDYTVDDGEILISPKEGGHGNLYTREEYGDFVFRFEFKLTPGANNGLGIRTPVEGDAAYVGMELQILDNDAPEYKNLQPYQYHGSVYGVIPAKRGFLKPTGEWNYEEVIAKGNKIKIILNNEVIVDGDITDALKNGTADHKSHPGLGNQSGHIGFLGHGSVVRFRNIRVKRM
jgi:HEAT repeat protein